MSLIPLMRQCLERLLFSALLLGCVMGHVAAQSPAPRTITVAIDDHFTPLAFRSTEGDLQGISVDLWRLWEARTGIKVQFEVVPFASGQALVR